ncbi:28S ribosomal protein S31, mitochondrial isoform X2 [Periophthalmus magnuspinnatus]|uniref:28S ribosomal protein S31, mitochondrial isoform X2 n=1 Tax=Periophthalmus magnuspinnatus TaxID=409849 RepID=UPI0024365957|nr:28S ribosomal protein S31, mitochondrial isoform X2 [Periophthalmus magnuspinnatus]
MFNTIVRNLFSGPNTSVKFSDAFAFAFKCDKSSTAHFRLTNTAGAKGLRTCIAQLCEKTEVPSGAQIKSKSSVHTPDVDVERNPGIDTANESASTSEPDATTPVTEKAKSGKEGLLNLLGAMKVEVTNKRKLKGLKGRQEISSTPKPRPNSLESTISMFQDATVKTSQQSETLSPDLVAAASAAASTLPNPSQAESELLQQLRQHETITEAQKKGDGNNIGVIIAEMKIGKNPNRSNARPANQIRFDDDGRGYTHERGITGELDSVRKRRNLFTAKRLNIFSPSEVTALSTVGTTVWDIDYADKLSTVTNHMPRNGFEELIQWTQQGKMWQYPIDNDTGLEEEANVPFHEHVFLEKHLEEGFPRRGPVRHFMELVITGLSRNPHLTVEQKKEHIFWFRDYFSQKEEVLKEDDVYLN